MTTRLSGPVRLLRVLLSAAWADSDLSPSELNYIKNLARRFNLDDEEWFALQPYLEDSPGAGETEAIVDDFLSGNTPEEHRAAAAHVRAILEADGQIGGEERAFLEQFEELLGGTSSLNFLLQRIQGLLKSAPSRPTVDLDEFLRNKILFKLRRRTVNGEVTPEMHRLALIGGLMGIVAQADGEIDERELGVIRRELNSRGLFEDDTLDVLIHIIGEESVRGLDRYRLVTEYCQDCSLEDRKELLNLLFLVAAADGALTHTELEELRSISSALQLSHKEYINAKVRVLD